MTRACLFSHFDRHDELAPHVLHYVRHLRELEFDVRFVTTAALAQHDIAMLESLGASVLVRENVGYDFGSWKYAIELDPELLKCDEVLLANDSVYGPLQSFESLYDRMRHIDADVVGMTDSLQVDWHLQSYLLLFKSLKAVTKILPELLSLDFSALSKREIIEEAEVGLGALLKRHGMVGRAVYPIADLDEGEYSGFCNPTHQYWRKLVERGAPFIKVELLRDNPDSVDISGWDELLNAHGFMEPEIVRAHLRRMKVSPSGKLPSSIRIQLKAPLRPLIAANYRKSALHRALVRAWRQLQHRRRATLL